MHIPSHSAEAGTRLWRTLAPRKAFQSPNVTLSLRKLGVDYVGILLPFVFLYPHLPTRVSLLRLHRNKEAALTFLNVLRPARMLPPVHVV
jgi:hypothetical protein